MNPVRQLAIAATTLALVCSFPGNSAAATAATPPSQPLIHVAFGPTTPEAIGLDDAFIAFLDGAESTLDMAFYEIRLDPIADAIIRAHKRGVKIRLVVDNDNYLLRQTPTEEGDEEVDPAGNDESAARPASRGTATSPRLNPFIQRLVDAGVPVHDDDNRAALMHNKFAVRDGSRVWTGSYNLTDTCSYKNVNNAVWIDSPDLAKIYTDELEEMFEKHQFGISSPALDNPREIKVGTARLESLFAPEDNPNRRIIELLAAARKEVYFMQFAFTADDLGDMLVRKHREKVRVSGIFDRILYRSTGPYGEFARLTEAGIPVVIHGGTGKFHNKLFLIDPTGDDPVVVLGSENASSNGNRTNDENVLIIHSPEIARLYLDEFRKNFGKTSTVSAELNVGEFPFAGTMVGAADLLVFANGQDVGDLRIEFPARWNLASQSSSDIGIYRNGVETTAREKMRVDSRAILLLNADLQKSGPRSWLMVRFRNVNLPAKPGSYAIPCSVRNRGGEFTPLTTQPTIQVVDGQNPADFATVMTYIKRLNLRLDKSGPKLTPQERSNQLSRLANLNSKLFQLVVKAAHDGDFDRVELGIALAEGMDPVWLRYACKVTNDMRSLAEELQYQAAHGEAPDRANAFLARLNAVVKKARP